MNSPTTIAALIPAFNPGERLGDVLNALTKRTSDKVRLEIIVIDDASTIPVGDRFGAVFVDHETKIRFLRTPRNLGRAAAINYGADQASSDTDAFLLLDADCVPIDEDFLCAHVSNLRRGASASVGPVIAQGTTFWPCYLNMVNARRVASASTDISSMTTANIVVAREAFISLGGFDPAFSRYGFEDRDFLIRLREEGKRISYCSSAVIHEDEVNLASVMRKMRESGRYTSQLFRTKHPEAYQHMGYARVDAAIHSRLGAVLAPFGYAAIRYSSAIENVLQSRILPFRLRAEVARICSALAYLVGTRDGLEG